MKDWNEKAAKKWLYLAAMDIISDGLYAEGGELIYYYKFNKKTISREYFIFIIKDVLSWDHDMIEDAIEEVRKLALSAFI